MPEHVIVTLPNGNKKTGTIGYRRYAPPDFKRVDAYSIILDEKRNAPRYTGSMFAAYQVKLIDKEST